MTNFIKCGKCIACTKFNGLNGNGYQPCHNQIVSQEPVPEYVEPPRLVNLYPSETSKDLVHGWDWILVWFFGFCFGISIGLLISKFS